MFRTGLNPRHYPSQRGEYTWFPKPNRNRWYTIFYDWSKPCTICHNLPGSITKIFRCLSCERDVQSLSLNPAPFNRICGGDGDDDDGNVLKCMLIQWFIIQECYFTVPWLVSCKLASVFCCWLLINWFFSKVFWWLNVSMYCIMNGVNKQKVRIVQTVGWVGGIFKQGDVDGSASKKE